MTKMKQFFFILTLGLIMAGLSLFIVDRNEKEMVINEELLNPSGIEYLEITGMYDDKMIKIKEDEKIETIILLLQQLNGSAALEHLPPSDEPLFGLHIALKGHNPSSAIIVYQDKIFHGKGRYVSGELVNEFVKTVEKAADFSFQNFSHKGWN